MPLTSKRSKAAKHICLNTPNGFAKPTPHIASPEGSEYLVSDNNSDNLGKDVESSDESEIQGVEALQCLYSMFLPPHLCLKEKKQEKHQNTKNRKPVYSGDSWTTIWQKGTALKCAAEGCMMLDAFVVKRVCPLSVKQLRSKLGTHFS
jgi:hypothetical protein